MNNIGYGKIKIKDIKHVENSRLREKDDVSDLMKDIKERGLMEPVGIRKSDNALIFGNRRVKAYEKLNFDEIDCVFFSDIDDEGLIIANVAENIKRKQIGAVEIGRIVNLLMKKGMTQSEIAEKLGISKNKVQSSHSCYNHVKGTPFEKLVVSNRYGPAKGRKGIPETLVWAIQDLLKRSGRKGTKDEWNEMLAAAEEGKITGHNISTLRYIMIADPNISIQKALDILDRSKIVYAYLALNRKVMVEMIKKEKVANDAELIRLIVRKYNSDLLF